MTEVPASIPVPGIADDPHTGPTEKVRGGWVALISLGSLGLYVGYYGPLQVLLPEQAQAIAGSADKVAALGWVTALGAVAAMISQPLIGALSDRTTSRYGRRHPWILGGAVLAAVALAFLSGQHTIAGMIVGWMLAQFGLNALQSALNANVPDRVPVRQRGFASGWISLQQTLGVVVGVALVALLVTGVASGFVAVAVVAGVFALPFLLFTRSLRLDPADRPPFNWGEFARAFWVSPRRYPDFAWAWLTRFLVMLGDAMAIAYLLYFLEDKVHFHQQYPKYTASQGLLLLILVYAVGVTISAVFCGRLSDRIGRRKVLVTISGLVMALPALVLAIWPSWWVTVGGALVLGLGFGAYLAVDLALVTQVLPSRIGHAKDLGIIAIASSGSQVLASAFAALIVSNLGYPALFLTVVVLVVLGAVLVWKVRSVP
ncbi:MAG: MFS transporter [Streptosporangiales bacterium]|nr:MFS transporter [Streptosporangiales bacterium]